MPPGIVSDAAAASGASSSSGFCPEAIDVDVRRRPTLIPAAAYDAGLSEERRDSIPAHSRKQSLASPAHLATPADPASPARLALPPSCLVT